MRRLLVTSLVSVALLGACSNQLSIDITPIGDGAPEGERKPGARGHLRDLPGLPSGGALTNRTVFERLSPTCRGCHTAELPYFVDLASFEGAIVHNPAYIVPSDPDASRLMAMLAGTDPQPMPIGVDNYFAAQEERGETQITMAELRQWIEAMPETPVEVPQDIPLVRRKTAEQIARTLSDQLGLVQEDFFYVADNYGVDLGVLDDDRYPIYSPDSIPNVDTQSQATTLFSALGGPWHLEGRARNDEITQTFLQAFTHISQAWCRLAVEKESAALFAAAQVADGSADPQSLARVRENIAAWHLRMLGVAATEADVDELLAVFRAYEPRGTAAAWTATCATIVRDPLWLTY